MLKGLSALDNIKLDLIERLKAIRNAVLIVEDSLQMDAEMNTHSQHEITIERLKEIREDLNHLIRE